jgi:uncharacterized repeat protein (TIGR02543 family)
MGWFTSKTGGTKVTATTPIAKNASHTLYAHWQANKYKVNFSVNKGKALAKSKRAKYVTYDSKYGKLPVAKKSGYKLVGWYTKAKGGKKITAKSKVKITKTTKLYAHWKRK